VTFTLGDLHPRTTYYYRAALDGKKPGPIGRFVTAPAPEDLSRVSFCFSGDMRESYQPFTIMSAIEGHQPDFFLHLGDTIYADRGGRARRLSEFWQKHRANRADPFFQKLIAQTSLYTVWDDHEVEDNYLPENPLAPIGRKAFLDYWPVRPAVNFEAGIYRSFRWGKACALFILDTRSQRNHAKQTMLGEKQREWLFNHLESSDALVNFIATSVPMFGGGSDRWDGFPGERTRLLKFVFEKRLPVVFLSADMHYAAVSRIPNGYGLKEITAGPLASPMNVFTNGAASRFEFYSNETFNFAKITVDPRVAPSHVMVEFYDTDNRLMHRTRIVVG
jgi:alkaline phosphatase D